MIHAPTLSAAVCFVGFCLSFGADLAVAQSPGLPRKIADLATPPVDEGKLFFKEDLTRGVLTFSPGDRYLAASYYESSSCLGVWETKTGRRVAEAPDCGWTYLPGGQGVFVQCWNDQFDTRLEVRYNLATATNQIVGRYQRAEFEFGRMLISPNEKWVAANLNPIKKPKKIVVLRDGDEKKPVPLGEGRVEQFAFSPDSSRLAVRTDDDVRIYNLDDKTERKTAAPATGLVLSFVDNGRALAAGDVSTGSISLYGVESGEPIKEIALKSDASDAGATAVAFAPVEKVLATGDALGIVTVKNWETGREIARFPAFESRISTLAFSSDGKVLATATEGKRDVIARLWALGESP